VITAINANNNDLYKELFSKASEILSGYQSVQTYNKDTQYWYKNPNSKSYEEYDLTNGSEEELTESDLINNFADGLVTYGKLYIKTREKPVAGFSPELGITSLEEYYNWLPELKVGKDEKPTIFTRLPLDEPHFEINANTRAITIPGEFKKNGIGVQGDDLAEIVYFTIDRFFDAIDLNNTEIYIEWETPKNKTTGQAVKSVSEPYLQIIDKVVENDEQKDKLVFGWAISEAITKDSGTLKFAVRFLQRNDENKIVYSFNTLTAQVTIHPNLGTDIMAAIPNADNCNSRLLERIQESEIIGGAQAQIPYFLKNLVVVDDGYDIEDDPELQVVATADDTGFVSYIWKRSELDENNNSKDAWIEISDKDAYGEKMLLLTQNELESWQWNLPKNRIFYTGPNEDDTVELGLDKYNLKLAFKDDDGDGLPDIPNIYEYRAYLKVDKYGKYKAEARNRIFNSLTKFDSEIVTYKRPDAIVIDNSD
jgi:hypothetical protein